MATYILCSGSHVDTRIAPTRLVDRQRLRSRSLDLLAYLNRDREGVEAVAGDAAHRLAPSKAMSGVVVGDGGHQRKIAALADALRFSRVSSAQLAT